ncbi:MAG: EAL domain-containing protein [Lachnospiraceae bacterium]|nr:EAL domain-containing protein [Lachnospiraceae bacterium]
MQILTFDECALFIILLFWISAIGRKEYRNRSGKLLVALLTLILITVIADLGGGTICDFCDGGRPFVIQAYIYNYLYFFCHNLLLPIYMLYIYSSLDLWHIYRKEKIRHIGWWILVLTDIVVLALNGFVLDVFELTDDITYVRGPWLTVFYVVALIFIIWILITLIRFRHYIVKDKLSTLIFLFLSVTTGLVIQLTVSELLVECFSIALAVLFFMVMLRRAGNQINPITGAQKYTACIERVTMNFKSAKPISVMFVKIVNNNNLHMYLGLKGHNEFLYSTTSRIDAICAGHGLTSSVYYMENGLYAIVSDETVEEIVADAAEEIMASLTAEHHIGKLTVFADVRVCVVFCPQDMSDPSSLFSLGTNFHRTLPDTQHVHFYRDFKDNDEYKVRNDLDDILRRAVRDNNFEMYYQPIYSVREKKFVAAEAMIRLNDPIYGQVPPALFIPAAEINGCIHDIGDFVFNDVIRFISGIDMNALGLKYIEMNLSASQCIEVDLVDKIKNLMFEYGVDPRFVSFELTEAATDMNPEIVDVNIRKLHEYGVKIALDDYGTGYSNIKRTTGLPIDQVKLDKSFVDMIDDPQMCIVIQDTISMFKEMDKEVLVEGVEEEAVARKFSDLEADLIQGCELMQGFIFCKPIPGAEFLDFIRKYRNRMFDMII